MNHKKVIFNKLVDYAHQAFLDINQELNLGWKKIPYPILSDDFRIYEEKLVEYILKGMIKYGVIRKEYEDILENK
jgi:hypothetical protein